MGRWGRDGARQQTSAASSHSGVCISTAARKSFAPTSVRDSRHDHPDEMCPKMQVVVLERTREPGKKILMSGGSRCNILPAEVDLQADFCSSSPSSAMRAIFASWGVWDCWSWLNDPEHVGIQLELEEASNKWFPASNSSKEVRDKLVKACECVVCLEDVQIVKRPRVVMQSLKCAQNRECTMSSDL
jgi:predicted flavoprotein YhiN